MNSTRLLPLLAAVTAVSTSSLAEARYYDATVSVWLSPDPIGMPDGPNRYDYVAGVPTKFTDPTGLCRDPGGTGARVCIDSFIPQANLGGFQGDNRGANPGGGSFRTEQLISGIGTGNVTATFAVSASHFNAPGISLTGQALPGPNGISGGGGVVEAYGDGINGVLQGIPMVPHIDYDLLIDTRPASLNFCSLIPVVSGELTAFPSFEVWLYEDGVQPLLMFYNDVSTTGTTPFSLYDTIWLGG